MDKTKMKNILANWLEEKNLKRFDLTNIAFVPRRTFEDVMNGMRSLPALYRLFLVTGLDMFKLSNTEQEQYNTIKRIKTEIQKDEMICLYFMNEWTNRKSIPSGEDMLSINNHDSNDKKEWANNLYKKYILTKPVTGAGTNISTASSEVLKKALEELEISTKLPKDEFMKYVQNNSKNLKGLANILNIIISDGPNEAWKRLNVMNQISNH